MRQKRYPLLLDESYPPESRVLDAIHSIPEGERTGFIRALILAGHQEIVKDEQRQQQIPPARADDGAEKN